MRPLRIAVAVAAFFICASGRAASRITFDRIIPAPHDLQGAQDLAVIYAIGDTDSIATFLSEFIYQTNHPGTIRVHDATSVTRNEMSLRRLRRRVRAERYLRISAFTCTDDRKSGDVGGVDIDGKRVRRKQHWVDAVCTGHIDMLDAETLSQISSFNTRGEGTSPRVGELTGEESNIAVDQAARYAAVAAAEQITPRPVRETIALDENAPSFADGMAMIDAERVAEARKIWESAAVRQQDSAPLQFNLAAVSEALGDVAAAQMHYREAARLAPKESRYRVELERFRRRNGIK
jgi:tetratricopeptide (TPR) repeat protein